MRGFTDFIKSILAVRKNSTGAEFRRRRLNFVEGSNVTLTVADDPTDDEVDITIAAAGSTGNFIWPYYGGDGVIAFDGTTTVLGLVPSGGKVYTLTRDIYLAGGSSLDGTATISTVGFRIFCDGTFTVNGIIHADGNPASGLTAGTGGGGTSGTTTLDGGSAGVNGRNTVGNGANSSSTDHSSGAGHFGGKGGDGGNSGGGNSGGVNTAPVIAVVKGSAGIIYNWHHGEKGVAQTTSGFTNVFMSGGTGGAGGGAKAASTSGGGGGGGGLVVLAAKTITGSGTIRANGGTGGNATVLDAGGGGGGGGGVVFVYGTVSGVTLQANGGTGGALSGTGSAGSNGGAGTVVNFTA